MAETDGRLRGRIRGWMQPLLGTPLHPQWLVARRVRVRNSWVATRAHGKTLDIGCSDASIRAQLAHVDDYTGLDYPGTAAVLYHTRPDVFGDAARLPFVDGSFDTVLLLDVLEHLAEPEAALYEARRVLAPGGQLLLTVPFAYPLHDKPYDYQRFTEFGLAHRLKAARFVRQITEESGNGVEAGASMLALAMAQGGIDALSGRRWRLLFMPLLPPLMLLVNVFGWMWGALLPARGLAPGSYYVHAWRD